MAVIDRKAVQRTGDARCPTCGGRVEEKGRDAEGRIILICSSCGNIRVVKKPEADDGKA